MHWTPASLSSLLSKCGFASHEMKSVRSVSGHFSRVILPARFPLHIRNLVLALAETRQRTLILSYILVGTTGTSSLRGAAADTAGFAN